MNIDNYYFGKNILFIIVYKKRKMSSSSSVYLSPDTAVLLNAIKDNGYANAVELSALNKDLTAQNNASVNHLNSSMDRSTDFLTNDGRRNTDFTNYNVNRNSDFGLYH